MRVDILGPLVVVVDGTPVTIGGARLRALLIRLALDAGRVVSTESLSRAMWPDGGPAAPANALQSLVSRLRRALPPGPPVRSLAGGYLLDIAPDAVDALRFERLARDGRRALRDGAADTAGQRLRTALDLWRGEALADVLDFPFAAATVARLAELRLTAVEDRMVAELEGVPDHAQLIAELGELIAAHPLRERLRGLLVRALHADGRQAEALAAYAEFRQLLADELGAEPGPELRDAHVAVLRSEPARPRPAGPGPRGNLRAALTSFVGREAELARVDRQLRQGRLVTLVGPGGAGKTRLAATVAAGIAEDLPGGVWLVELAPVADPGELAQALVGTLGLRGSGQFDPTTGLREAGPSGPGRPGGGGRFDSVAGPPEVLAHLVDALSATRTLIVLDNCEHLIDAVARLVEEMLGHCPRLSILATSREPLNVSGEALCQVPPLRLPEPAATAEQSRTSPAIRLFADRAVAVRPEFQLTDDNLGVVAEICRRLDGLPLAIELAAARLRSLPVAELAARLDDRFQVLTGGRRTALPRHRTLRAVVAWSWDLLDDSERRLARRLAVFPATISPAAAAWVGAPEPGIPATLDALVDKSLLQTVEGPELRYRMLETVREYGLERLAASGEVTRVRDRHAGYFLELAERAAPLLRGTDQVPWIARLSAERENLSAAFHFAFDTGDAETTVRLAAALGHFWTILGSQAEPASWLRMVLAVPGPTPPESRTVVAASYLLTAVLSGDPAAERIPVEELRTWVGGTGEGAGHPTNATGHPTNATSHPTNAVPHPTNAIPHPAGVLLEPMLGFILNDTAEGLAAVDERLAHQDPWARAVLRLVRSFIRANDGDLEGVRRDLTEAVEEFRRAGDRWGLATSLTFRAHAQITLGDFDGAIAALEESMVLLRQLDKADDTALQRVLLAATRAQRGDTERARTELSSLVAQGVGISSARYHVLARISLGDLARCDGDLAEAARQYDTAWQDLSATPFDSPLYRAMIRCGMGHLAIRHGAPEVARQNLAEGLALAVDPLDSPILADIGVGVAGLRRAEGAVEDAARVLGAAQALRGAPDAFDPDVVRLVDRLRAELGDAAYQTAHAYGQALQPATALALIQDQLRPG